MRSGRTVIVGLPLAVIGAERHKSYRFYGHIESMPDKPLMIVKYFNSSIPFVLFV